MITRGSLFVFNSRIGLKAIARVILVWVICQSTLSAAMPIMMDSDCCPHASSHLQAQSVSEVSHSHEVSHEIMPLVMASMDNHDHSQCEHCAFGCQLITSVPGDIVHSFTLQAPISPTIFSIINSSFELPFRPPILL
ncbi:MAG: hypothetical protein ACRBBR_00955 [Cellvibrionaceae bacterium]